MTVVIIVTEKVRVETILKKPQVLVYGSKQGKMVSYYVGCCVDRSLCQIKEIDK